MEITITIHVEPAKIKSYERSLRELPGRTDEDWEKHLAYELHDGIDKVIEQARLYREWRGEPPIYKLRELAENLHALAAETGNSDLVEIISSSPLEVFFEPEESGAE
jgi:hypothetical protein